MRTIILLFISILSTDLILAQSIVLGYSDVDIGRNIGLIYTTGTKHQFYGGLKFHINSTLQDNQSNTFRKRFYASNLREHIGLQAGYQFRIPLTVRSAIATFYDCQFTVAGTRSHFDLVPTIIPGVASGLTTSNLEFDELKALEQYIGVAVEADFWNNIFILFRIGGGIAFFWDIPYEYAPNQFYLGGPTNWEFGSMVSFSIGYRL